MFSFSKRMPVVPGLCCVHIQPDEIALSHVIWQSDETPLLKLCTTIPNHPEKSLDVLLGPLVEEHALRGARCSWVLQPSEYRFFLLEALPVPAAEMKAALRWRIQDMIDFPIAEAAIDFFPTPRNDGKDQPLMLFVTVARMPALMMTVNAIKKTGLDLGVIDIPELALRNTNHLFDEDLRGLGILLMGAERSEIIITHENTLYLSRYIDIPFSELREVSEDNQLLLDNLALEIQRSFDYYQSQLHQPAPIKLLLTMHNEIIFNFLSTQLTNQVEILDIKKKLSYPSDGSDDLSSASLIAISGALRKEDTHAPGN